jgi:hypothetical protein
MKFLFSALLLIAGTAPTAAFPGGAGGCGTGGPAVGGKHLSADTLTTGSLAEGGVSVSVGGVAVGDDNAITVASGGEDLKSQWKLLSFAEF